jgi:hypothetical protein
MKILLKIITDTASYYGVYVAYYTVAYFIEYGTFKLIFDGDFIPFFFVLAIVNECFRSQNEKIFGFDKSKH